MIINFNSSVDWNFQAPSLPWKKFLSKFTDIFSLPLLEWKEVHCLAYFLGRYHEFYNRKYCLSFLGAPSRCQEIVLVKKVLASLGSSSAEIYIKYVDWIFNSKIKSPEKFQIRNISFLLSKGLTNEFIATKMMQVSHSTKLKLFSRASKLPDIYLILASKHNLEIQTYGDVAFLQQFLEQNPQSEYNSFFKDLQNNGFDLDSLKSLI